LCRVVEMKFNNFYPALEESFWLPLENPLFTHPEKNPSDAHTYNQAVAPGITKPLQATCH